MALLPNWFQNNEDATYQQKRRFWSLSIFKKIQIPIYYVQKSTPS